MKIAITLWTTRRGLATVAAFLGLPLASGCLGAPDGLAACDPAAGDRMICGVENPEDLGLLPGSAWLLVSEMTLDDPARDTSSEPFRPGRISAVRLADLTKRPLFPTDSPKGAAARLAGWGDPSCPGPPDAARFQPHGIDVGPGPGRRSAVAVVNHGGREAVEIFELLGAGEPTISWRGCVPLPEGILANDVAWVGDGGFVVTNMIPELEGAGPSALWTLVELSFGWDTGDVLRWQPGGELTTVPDSEGSAPNGIAVSADGTEIFVAEWGGKAVYRLRLGGEDGPRRDEVALDTHPDNLTWTRDGRLLVAGQDGGPMAAVPCGSIEAGGCDIAYSIYRLDPVGLEATRVREGRGAASVAQELPKEILVGVFAGDAIERVARPD